MNTPWENLNTPLLLVNDLEVKMNTPVWRGLAQTGVFISIKICVISNGCNTQMRTCAVLSVLLKNVAISMPFRFKSILRYLFPTTLLRAFAPKGARDFWSENAKNRPRSGYDCHSEACFLWFYSILGHFCPKKENCLIYLVDKSGNYFGSGRRIRTLKAPSALRAPMSPLARPCLHGQTHGNDKFVRVRIIKPMQKTPIREDGRSLAIVAPNGT